MNAAVVVSVAGAHHDGVVPSRRRICSQVTVALVLVASVVTIEAPASAGPPADPSCRSLFPGADDDIPEGSCRLVDETAVDLSTVHVYVHEDVPRGRVPDAELRERTADPVQRSWLEYTLVGLMPTQVDIVIVPTLPHGDDANAGPDDRGTCVIFVPVSTYRRPRLYKHTLAHELFHCFQYKQTGEDVWRADGHAGDWWFEGTAEYFANVVYPRENVEYEYLDTLRDFEPNHALVDLSYEAFAFFQHFANRQSNPAIVEFMQTMPPGGGRSAQMAAAAAWPGMDELFHDYARAFLTDAIIDASGASIPIGAEPETLGRVVIDRPLDVVRVDTLKKFQINRVLMSFEDHREFDLDYRESAGVRSAAQEHRDAAWEVLPDPVETCDDRRQFRLLMTTVAVGEDQSASLEVLEVTETGDDESSPACCAADAAGSGGGGERAETRQVRIVVCGAITAEFIGGICYVDDGFLMVTAGYEVFGPIGRATGPYPRGFAFILGKAEPGTESPGVPDVSISDGDRLTSHGTTASITKSADLLTGTFAAGDISGNWRCPRLTPPEEIAAGG